MLPLPLPLPLPLAFLVLVLLPLPLLAPVSSQQASCAGCEEACSPLAAKVAEVCTALQHAAHQQAHELTAICEAWKASNTRAQEHAPRNLPDATPSQFLRARREAAVQDAIATLEATCTDTCVFGADGNCTCTVASKSPVLLANGDLCRAAFGDYILAVPQQRVSVEVRFGSLPNAEEAAWAPEILVSSPPLLPYIRTLSIASSSLKTLSKEWLSSLTALETLDLPDNFISDLPEGVLDTLTSLTSLNLFSNQITRLPPRVFDRLSSLLHLSLSANWITALPVQVFDALTSLKSLEFDNNRLTELPPSIFSSLTSLTTLSFKMNRMSKLPSDPFTKLTALTALDFASNRIAQLQPGLFSHLTALESLAFSTNEISQLPAGIFDGLTALAKLEFSRNEISQLPSGIFKSLTALFALYFSRNRISQFPPGVFDSLRGLTWLVFHDNQVTQFPTNLFASLSRLSFLHLSNNRITQFPPGLFHPLAALGTLLFSNNRISQLPGSGVFDTLTNLKNLYANNNQISQLPPGLLSKLSALTILQLTHNQITQLPSGIFRSLTSLDRLDISSNNISQIAPSDFASLTSTTYLSFSDNRVTRLTTGVFSGLHAIQQLYFSSNRITQLPEGIFDALTAVTQLAFSGNMISELPARIFDALTAVVSISCSQNRIQRLPPGVFNRLPALQNVYLSNNKITGLSADLFAEQTSLTSLDLRSNKISELPLGIFGNLGSLDVLYLSDNSITHLDDDVFTALTSLTILHFSSNKITQLPLGLFDTLTILAALDLSSNPMVQDIQDGLLSPLQMLSFLNIANISATTLPSPLSMSIQYLNVSFNPLIVPHYLLQAEGIKTLDISGTRLRSSDVVCSRTDSQQRMSFFSARKLQLQSSDKSETFFNLAQSCLLYADIVDLSENDLSDITLVSSTLSDTSYILPVAEMDSRGNKFASQLKLGDQNPIQCSLDIARGTRFFLNVDTDLPILRFSCTCTQGFRQSQKGICKKIPDFWTSGKVAGLAVGMIFLTSGITLAILSAITRHRRVRADLELKQLLLEETQEEVITLKRAWEILPSELQLDVRIDGDSPGAFGEVWRATWDGITVAVKLLQKAAMDFDASAQEEFQREIEFMQKTRHPNIVRFFGAGQWGTGVPFFVVELVTRGSLKVFLRGKGATEPRPVDWSTKLRLALDVARGMAYIHSLGQVHRDLKSGNVLITEDVRAKITDFGTIRELFTRRQQRQGAKGLHASAATATTNSSSSSSSSLLSQTSLSAFELTAGKGTPLYMAPEVIRGGDYSQSADVWSFAILLWELAAQKSPSLLDQEGKFKGPVLGNILALLDQGKRLRADHAWPAWYVELMEKCWIGVGSERPLFSAVVDELEARMK